MNNNLLRCDLSAAQLEALAESKGGWWLLDSSGYFCEEEDTLLKEWNGFKFYFVNDLLDCPEEGDALGYIITPEGYYLAADCSDLDELDESEDVKKQLYQRFEEMVEDAIATILNFPATQGQLSLLELINA